MCVCRYCSMSLCICKHASVYKYSIYICQFFFFALVHLWNCVLFVWLLEAAVQPLESPVSHRHPALYGLLKKQMQCIPAEKPFTLHVSKLIYIYMCTLIFYLLYPASNSIYMFPLVHLWNPVLFVQLLEAVVLLLESPLSHCHPSLHGLLKKQMQCMPAEKPFNLHVSKWIQCCNIYVCTNILSVVPSL